MKTVKDFSDLDAELAVLKFALSGIIFNSIKNVINKEDFFFNKTKDLFIIMSFINDSLFAITYNNVKTHIIKNSDNTSLLSELDTVNLFNLENLNLHESLQRVNHSAALRELVDSVNQIINNNELKDNLSINLNLSKTIQLYKKRMSTFEALNYEILDHIDVVKDVLSIIKENEGKTSDLAHGAISTGFHSLDKIIGGFIPGDVTVIGADSHTGKTIFLTNIISRIAAAGHSVLFIGLEGSSLNIGERIISGATTIPMKQFTRPATFKSENFQILNDYKECAEDFHIRTLIKSGLTIDDIDSIVEKEVNKNNTRVIFIDHIHAIIDHSNKNKNDSLTDISTKLQALAGKGVVVVALSQLNRDLKHRIEPAKEMNGDFVPNENIPTNASIRGSDAITQYSDNIMFISRPKNDNNSFKPKIRVTVSKNRNDSELDEFMLYFNNDSAELSEDEEYTNSF